MFSRQAVIDRWQQCLAESESLSAEPPSRFSFYHRVRVRLYRFLLACYGSGEWRADESAPTDAGESPLPSSMPLVETAGPLAGKPPKAGESIRTVLEHIHTANEGAASATSISDRPPASPRGSRRRLRAPAFIRSAAVSLLRRRGGQARLVRRGDDVIVEVPRDDLDKALQLIAQTSRTNCEFVTGGRPRHRGGRAGDRHAGWMFAVWLAIALICSVATGKATWGELSPGSLSGWS